MHAHNCHTPSIPPRSLLLPCVLTLQGPRDVIPNNFVVALSYCDSILLGHFNLCFIKGCLPLHKFCACHVGREGGSRGEGKGDKAGEQCGGRVEGEGRNAGGEGQGGGALRVLE